jgi:hypothetical protein
MSNTRLATLWLIPALAVACSFDAGKLRRSASQADSAADLPASSPDAPEDIQDTAIALAETGDASGGGGSGGAPPSTGGVGGTGGSTIDSAGTDDGDVPGATGATGGTDSNDAPSTTGGTGSGGAGASGGATGSTGGAGAMAGSGGASSDGGSGGSTVVGGGVAGTGGGASSGGQISTDGSDGGGADGASDISSNGGGGGGQSSSDGQLSSGGAGGGSGGVSSGGGTNGGSTGGSSDAGTSDSRICAIGQCPPTATIGITGPWGATYSNGSSGSVVTSGDAVFLNWLATRGTGCVVQNLDISGNNYLSAARLAPYAVIIVLDTYHTQADKAAFFNAKLSSPAFPAYPGTQRAFLASEVTAIRDWVNNGGGLMTTIGTASGAAERANTNLLLNPFGIAYSVTDVNILPGNSLITAFSTAAPIASQLAAGITTLRVSGAVAIEGLAGGNLPPNSSTFSMYASSSYSSRAGPGTYALGAAKIVGGTGRINVWGDEMITYDSSWNTSMYQTQTYWNNALTWLGQCP